MLRLGVACCMVLWLGQGLALGQVPSRTPKSGPGSSPENTLFGKLFGKKEPPPAPTVAPRINPREQAAAEIMKEQKLHLQRLAVCTRLRELAIETEDEALNRKADELEKQAYEIYAQRVSHLPGARESSTSESVLDRNLGSDVATDPIRSASESKSKDKKATAERKEKP